jgi:hypothetical protein
MKRRMMALLLSTALGMPAGAQEADLALSEAGAGRFAGLALKGLDREYPNKLDHVMNSAEEVKGPRALHPAFYGCFDWHSSVHGHWMLMRLLREHPAMPGAAEARAILDAHLVPAAIAGEVAYLGQPGRKSFERTYGWAWLLKLAAELKTWDDADARRWSAALQPLADRFATQFEDFLPKQTYPIRTGVHPNTAFSLHLALDYARAMGDTKLEALLRERAMTYYGKDRRGPLAWEPGGEDFLSPCLEESALMAEVLPRPRFARWLRDFLPGLPKGLAPAVVTDRSDPKLVHLDGLNLSRARALYEIAQALGLGHPAYQSLRAAGDRHARASLPYLASGNYEGEHWLATFAVQMLVAREALGH